MNTTGTRNAPRADPSIRDHLADALVGVLALPGTAKQRVADARRLVEE